MANGIDKNASTPARARRALQQLSRELDEALARIEALEAAAGGGDGSGNVRIYQEVPTGTIDGDNLAFNLAFEPLTGTVELKRNGLTLSLVNDFTIAGDTITFIAGEAPEAGAILRASYTYTPA